MNNKENMQQTVSNEHLYSSSNSNINETFTDCVNNLDKVNCNSEIKSGWKPDSDNSTNILTVKSDNTLIKSSRSEDKHSNSYTDMKQNELRNSDYKQRQDANADQQNGNTSLPVSNKPTVQSNNAPSTNLRRTHMAKSNPHLNRNSSYVDVHPLSSSMMVDTSRNGQNSARGSITGFNSQIRYSQSSNQLSDDILQRTLQFTPSQIPIVGYEVMEERARFTIYKLRIDDPRTGLSWMVFRRYTDFVRLYQKLKLGHRDLILPLPEKRLFRNGFDPSFLEERTRGLQLFVNAVVRKLALDRNVREFFCLDEPPDVGDSEPEAQALFGALEDTVGGLKNQLKQQEETIKYLRQKAYYLEEKMKACSVCNPLRSNSNCNQKESQSEHSPVSSSSSNGS